jgi:hypothetical protein
MHRRNVATRELEVPNDPWTHLNFSCRRAE